MHSRFRPQILWSVGVLSWWFSCEDPQRNLIWDDPRHDSCVHQSVYCLAQPGITSAYTHSGDCSHPFCLQPHFLCKPMCAATHPFHTHHTWPSYTPLGMAAQMDQPKITLSRLIPVLVPAHSDTPSRQVESASQLIWLLYTPIDAAALLSPIDHTIQPKFMLTGATKCRGRSIPRLGSHAH